MATIGKASIEVVLIGTLLWVGTAHATDPVVKCQKAKLKAQGKLELCLQKSSARVLGGKPDASADCEAQFQSALGVAEHIAIAAGTTACRFVDNGNSTVSDLNTGLLWEKKDAICPGAHCYSDRFSWGTFGPDRIDPDGTIFTTFLYGFNGGTSADGMATSGCFAGHCDWRLPTLEELTGIVDVTQGQCSGGTGPCIDPTFGLTQIFYLSATTYTPAPFTACGVSFIIAGDDGCGVFKVAPFAVRAVRGGLTQPPAVQSQPETPQVRCEQAKLTAQGKLDACMRTNAARVVGGKHDKSAACRRKFDAAVRRADQIGVAAGTASCRYIDNGDGTVSDLNTGLLWEQKDATCPGTHCDTDTFTWCGGGSDCTDGADPPNGTAFVNFLYSLNDGMSLNDMLTVGCFTSHCDWRLPTVEELAGIVDVTQGDCGASSGPCIDPVFGATQDLNYWSATTNAGLPSGAWVVPFGEVAMDSVAKPNLNNVRAVRGGS